ncbi:MAG: hypothetical protein A2W03_03930 [Candidatus Aminicenantes bacterium RBG_16_63_16]|nr:MAG: hypothetical protein A2W03_03930 [Candidatus Aminicenantes bacterium RBG_16_63_16]
MVRPVLALDRLLFLEPEGKVGYTEYAVVDRIIRHLKLEFLTPFCSREYPHFVRGGAYFGPNGSELSDAQKRNLLNLKAALFTLH